MRTKMLMLISLMMAVAGAALAADPITTEMFPLLEKARSAKQTERQDALCELLALREAVSDELTKIVIDANNGHAESGSKASALFLMGELGLMQCRDLLEREIDWTWKPPLQERTFLERRRLNSLIGQTAKMALNRLTLADNVTLAATRQKIPLTEYPQLSSPLADLRSPRRQTRRKGEDSVLRWYDVVCRSMRSVLEPSRQDVYLNEVRATAAFVLGEYRSWYAQMLLWNIALKDEKGVCNEYAQTLIAKVPEPEYPCTVAMIKLGYRADIMGALSRIETKSYLSQQTRDRIARVLVAIDKDMTEKLYNSEIAGLENAAQWNATEQDRLSRLQLLRTIEPIIKQ